MADARWLAGAKVLGASRNVEIFSENTEQNITACRYYHARLHIWQGITCADYKAAECELATLRVFCGSCSRSCSTTHHACSDPANKKMKNNNIKIKDFPGEILSCIPCIPFQVIENHSRLDCTSQACHTYGSWYFSWQGQKQCQVLSGTRNFFQKTLSKTSLRVVIIMSGCMSVK